MSAAGKTRISSAKLSDGHTIPLLAYGTGTALFKSSNFNEIDRTTVEAVKTAIKLGFNHIDCAELYNTEPEVGIAIKESGIPRQDLFITTKVITNIKNIPAALDASLKKLQVDHVDLYLIHSPWFASSDAELQAAWREMEKVQKAGKAKSIGVSNYLQNHLESTLAIATIPPAINQVEYHPYLQRQGLLPFCQTRGITLSAFGPLTAIRNARPGPCDAPYASLAEKYGVSEEAVALRWCVDQGVVAVTTSGKEERLRDYLAAMRFELAAEEVEAMKARGAEKHWRGNNFMHDYPADDRS